MIELNKQEILITALVLGVILVGTLIFFYEKSNLEEKKANVVYEVETLGENNFRISAEEIINKINNKEDLVILDVRTQAEYIASHIVGATLFPLQALSEQSLSDFDLGNKNAEIVIYCQSGNRSVQAYELMKNWGYTNIKDLNGGIQGFIDIVVASSTNSELIVSSKK